MHFIFRSVPLSPRKKRSQLPCPKMKSRKKKRKARALSTAAQWMDYRNCLPVLCPAMSPASSICHFTETWSLSSCISSSDVMACWVTWSHPSCVAALATAVVICETVAPKTRWIFVVLSCRTWASRICIGWLLCCSKCRSTFRRTTNIDEGVGNCWTISVKRWRNHHTRWQHISFF